MNINKGNNWKLVFFLIWSGQFVSLFSSSVVQFAIIWWLTYRTGSARTLSIAAIISLLPEAVLNPFIGALVDKWNRRAILIISDLIIALSSLLLAALFLFGFIQIFHIYFILFIRSICGCFHRNSMLSSTSLLVPKGHLTQIAGLNQTLNGMMMFVAPLLGALFIKLGTFQMIMLFDVIGALVAVLPLLFVKIPQPSMLKTQSNRSFQFFQEIADGFKYIKKWPGAIGMLVISTIVNFILQPVFMLVAIFVTKYLRGDEIKYGLLGAAIGMGFMVGGITLGIWKGFKRKMLTSLFGIIGAGAAVLIAGLLPAEAFSGILFCFFAAGFMMPVCMGPIQSLVQCSVNTGMQGRVFSIMSSLSTIVAPISLGIAGIVFDLFSVQLWYFWGGLTVIVTGITGFFIKNIRNIDNAPGG